MHPVVTIEQHLPAIPQPVSDRTRQVIRSRHAESTRRAYAADVRAFDAWVRAKGLGDALAASPAVVADFLTEQADAGLKPATLTRRLAAIRYMVAEAQELGRLDPNVPVPTDAKVVRDAMAGIRRTVGTAQRKAAPATADRLRAMLDACGDGLQGLRDRALLALGFGGAFRRGELVALTVADIEATADGLMVRLVRSKTDQEGRGQQVPVLDGPRLRVKAALEDWIAAAGITEGPVFRTLGKGGRVLPRALTDRSVADIVKLRAEQAGLDPALFSGHSLRAGFLTSAATAGASVFSMMAVSRHRKVDTLAGYVRAGQAFRDHAGQAFM
jgi:site-specific recombinase XerD